MEDSRFDKWLHRLRVTATLVYIVALCVAVAVLVIAFIPHSPVPTALPAKDVPGIDHVSGLAAGVTVDPSGTIAIKIAEPSAAQRLLYLVVVLPGLALVALIAGAWPSCFAPRSPVTRSTPRPSERSRPWPRSPRSAGSPCG